MPCSSEGYDPNTAERESKAIAGHIIYLNEKLRKPTPSIVLKAYADYYGNQNCLDTFTQHLCKTINNLTDEEVDKYVYDGRNAKARALADWWDKHKEWDERREREEQEKNLKEQLIKSAQSKLTEEEFNVLYKP